ncbi:HAD-like domain-containing protein [Phycomyces nitens]|nr:HAD-like domain-containing protein [Phycomyces nitens]
MSRKSLGNLKGCSTKPSKEYMELVMQTTKCSDPLKKKLLILDMNGTLVSRTASKAMYVRPYQDRFLDYIFKHFEVMVWSSAQPINVDRMCRMFEAHRPNLLKVWDRTSFNLTPAEYNKKTLTIKDLEIIWRKFDKYNATNTIMLDDSTEKLTMQPHNHVHIKTFDHLCPQFRKHGEQELLSVINYLDKLTKTDNVCNYIYTDRYVSPATNGHKDNSFDCYHYQFLRPEADRKMWHLCDEAKKPKDSLDTLEDQLKSIRL